MRMQHQPRLALGAGTQRSAPTTCSMSVALSRACVPCRPSSSSSFWNAVSVGASAVTAMCGPFSAAASPASCAVTAAAAGRWWAVTAAGRPGRWLVMEAHAALMLAGACRPGGHRVRRRRRPPAGLTSTACAMAVAPACCMASSRQAWEPICLAVLGRAQVIWWVCTGGGWRACRSHSPRHAASSTSRTSPAPTLHRMGSQCRCGPTAEGMLLGLLGRHLRGFPVQ